MGSKKKNIYITRRSTNTRAHRTKDKKETRDSIGHTITKGHCKTETEIKVEAYRRAGTLALTLASGGPKSASAKI